MKIPKFTPLTCAHRLATFSLRKGFATLLAVAALALAGNARAQLSATLVDYGATDPTPGADDASQLTFGTGNPDGLNYYFDNGNPPAQTFTTGANANGYVMNSVFIRTAGGSGGLPGVGQAYTLRLYSVSGSTATLLATYVSQTGFLFVDTDWLQWTNLGFGLQPNTQYAYSLRRNSGGWENMANVTGNLYAGGEVALIPTAGGAITFGSSHNFDATFDVSLTPATVAFANPPTISPASAVAVGTTATLTTAAAVGPGPLGYQWQTDGGSGGALTNIPGATSTSLPVNTTGYGLGVYKYAVIATNSGSASTSAVVSLTVFQESSAALTDIGTTITPGVYDISQQAGGGNGDGLNYYNDNNPPPGQIFTTGTNGQGYYLSSVTVGTGGGGNNGTATLQAYTLYLYSVSGSEATLLARLTNGSFAYAYGDWLKWDGFTPILLQSNKTYAYAFRRSTTGWAGMTSTPNTSDLYTGGQLCLIPTTGGTITFGNTGLSDAAFDLGLTPVGVGPSPYPFANTIAVSPSPIVVAGTTVTLSESATGNAPLYYQWRTDGGSGGALTNIPGATATNLSFNTTGWTPKAYRYTVLVSNSFGTVTSIVSTITVTYANTTALLEDIGGQDPQPLVMDDVSQLQTGSSDPDGMNYYFDNGAPPGQIFTTGAGVGGYTLTSLAIRTAGNSGGLPADGQSYTLRIYSVSGNAATLYAIYTSQTNFLYTHLDWLRWSGLALPLSPNTTYAYSFARSATGGGWEKMANLGGDLYAGGEVVLIPPGGGTMTLGSSHAFDATFIIGVAAPSYPNVSPATPSIRTPYAGSPITVSASVTGTGPFTYQWQTDGGNTGVMTNVPGATSTSLPVDTTGLDSLTVGYRLIAVNGSGSTTGEVALVTVNPASGPTLAVDTTPNPATGYLGGSVTFSASFAGTLPIFYQWQVDKGTGATNIPGRTNVTLTLNNLQASDAGSYSLFVSNSLSTASSSAAPLTVYPLPSVTQQLSGNQFTLTWTTNYLGWTLQVQTNPLSTGLGTNWVNVPGSTATNSQTLTVNPAAGTLFYRLVYP